MSHVCRFYDILSSKSVLYQLIPAIGVVALGFGLLPLLRLGWSVFIQVFFLSFTVCVADPHHWKSLQAGNILDILNVYYEFLFLVSFFSRIMAVIGKGAVLIFLRHHMFNL